VEATQALRQVLARAVVWQLLDHNPAREGVANPGRPPHEQRPFDSWRQLRAVVDQLATRDRAIVVFAAATGLRPGEWTALEWRDIDLAAGVVYVRRAYGDGEVKAPKTRRSLRAVPLQATALEALALLPRRIDSPLVFPGARGGYLDLHNWRSRAWRRAQQAAGIEPRRRVYDLRHTFATFALRAGVPTFDLCRYMGTSLAMIERHYGHLARDAHQHAVGLLDELAAAEAVDVAWTSGGRRRSRPAKRRAPIRRWEPDRGKPSNGLEPLTPSLPCKFQEGTEGSSVPSWVDNPWSRPL
jgi:integrase